MAQKACACFRPATQVKYTVPRNKKGLWKALGLDGRDQRDSISMFASFQLLFLQRRRVLSGFLSRVGVILLRADTPR